MARPRFYIPPASWNVDSLRLTHDEAHHCAAVMRLAEGDEVVTFDGTGKWARCRIVKASKSVVELHTEESGNAPAPAVHISLLQAIPKAGNMELIIEKAVELGANEIIPVLTDRTVVKLDAKEAAKKQEKWQRIALEACKQCGQNWMPEVRVPRPFSTVWAQLPPHDLRLVAAIQEDARPLKAFLATGERAPQQSALVAIGPEGDFTPAEYALARQQGCLPLSLGPIIMRVETAALFCLSIMAHELRPNPTPAVQPTV